MSRNRLFKWSPGTYFLTLDQPRMRLWCFDNGMFLVVSSGLPAAANSIPANWPRKYATCVRLKKRCFKGSHGILNLGQNKMLLISLRQRDVSSGRQPLLIHFLPLDQHKMRLGWGLESHVSRGRQALRIHFLPLDHPKMQVGWIENAIFQVVEWHFELFFCVLTGRKFDLSEVDKAIF